MLIKRAQRDVRRSTAGAVLPPQTSSDLDRRSFLRRSGLAAGSLAALGSLSVGTIRKAEAGPPPPPGATVTRRKNVCTHCSVGCTVIAEVANGVWTGQEPGWDSPINRGSHCCKGAAVRDDVHSERRLRYPVKLVNGNWSRISWDQAIDEIGDKLMEIRAKSGPESVYWLGSAKFTNEAAYLNRKLAAFWGTNNSDHQARICHSTTVAGVANTWGYGAMTNSYNDIRNAKTIMIMGGNPAEAHPVSLQHILEGKELNRANMIVIDPRFTRTAAHATEYVRVRPGTHIPTVYGLLWHIFQNGWEDKEFIRQRVYGMDEIRKEVEKWPPHEVERVTGLPEAQVKRVAEIFATQKPSTLIWAMGQTQYTVGTANVRASCILLLATGNVGHMGCGANIFRGHDNVQGATDLGLDVTTLPLYYGLAEDAWRHWCRVWEVDYRWMLSRFVNKTFMETPGVTSTRWFDATLLPKDQVSQPDTMKAMFVMGHGGNTIARMPQAARGIETLDLLVVCDPYPTTWALPGKRAEFLIYSEETSMIRKAKAVWRGTGRAGNGNLSTDSGVLANTPYSFKTRFENEKGTNPEELIAAAHAGCFTMALAFGMQGAGFTPTELSTEAAVTLQPEGQGFRISRSALTLRAKVPNLDEKKFADLARDAEKNCPVSKVLKAEIVLDAKLT